MLLEKESHKQDIPSSYEEALKELQIILDNLENQSISVDEISRFTVRARFLLQYCQDRIRKIEDKTEEML